MLTSCFLDRRKQYAYMQRFNTNPQSSPALPICGPACLSMSGRHSRWVGTSATAPSRSNKNEGMVDQWCRCLEAWHVGTHHAQTASEALSKEQVQTAMAFRRWVASCWGRKGRFSFLAANKAARKEKHLGEPLSSMGLSSVKASCDVLAGLQLESRLLQGPAIKKSATIGVMSRKKSRLGPSAPAAATAVKKGQRQKKQLWK